MMTKTELLTALDVSQSKLSRILGISRAAVSQWPANEPIPELQWLRLKDRRPKMLQRAIEAHVMGVKE
jgi:transcriptional regulator with XRE-family HTH domain